MDHLVKCLETDEELRALVAIRHILSQLPPGSRKRVVEYHLLREREEAESDAAPPPPVAEPPAPVVVAPHDR